jgi:thymidylate synthase (FAD)
MKIVKASYEILTPIDGPAILDRIEKAARTAYKSEDKICPGSAEKVIAHCTKRGHESVIEHESISVRIICDRGVSHELVRHRLASYTQESTRYCNYGKASEITVIEPPFWDADKDVPKYIRWQIACEVAEREYLNLLNMGASPQEARSVLPNSLKTEIVMTANLREWRHFFKLRTAPAAHPQMREITIPMLAEFKQRIPLIFDDIAV